MQTQRDHVHAHQFQVGRLSSALVLGDPSLAQDPNQRSITGLLVGILLAALALGGVGIYGWLVPGGNKDWQRPGTIIVEKETGNRYLYLNGVLHPTLNLTSAVLLGGSRAKVRITSRKSLRGAPRGAPIGIPGAPQVLPDASGLVRGPWFVCAGGTVSRKATDASGLNLDPGTPTEPLAGQHFALVAGGGAQYVLWQDRKYRIADRSVPVALGATNTEPLPVPVPWLDALPNGPDLGPAAIPNAGAAGPAIGGKPFGVGQLFVQRVAGGQDQLFTLRADGLAPLNRTEFVLTQAAGGPPPVELDAATVVGAPRSATQPQNRLPPELSSATLVDLRGRALCERQLPAGKESVASTVVLVRREYAALTADGAPQVHLRPGSGMVVYPVPLLESRGPEPFLVSDEGIRYAIGDNQTMTMLNLDAGSAVPIARSLLDRIPTGPVLSRAAITVAA